MKRNRIAGRIKTKAEAIKEGKEKKVKEIQEVGEEKNQSEKKKKVRVKDIK